MYLFFLMSERARENEKFGGHYYATAKF